MGTQLEKISPSWLGEIVAYGKASRNGLEITAKIGTKRKEARKKLEKDCVFEIDTVIGMR